MNRLSLRFLTAVWFCSALTSTLGEQNRTLGHVHAAAGDGSWTSEDTTYLEKMSGGVSGPNQRPGSAGNEKIEQDASNLVPDNYDIEPSGTDPALFFGARPPDSDQYRLGPEDVLEIRVFDMDQFNRTVRVSGSGSIDLPLIGLIEVQGLVADEAADRVAHELQDDFVQNPQVSVFVKEFNSRKLSLLGAVEQPATYPLLGQRSLLQLLAEAGGVTENADKSLFVFRATVDGRRARLVVPLRELLMDGDPLWDIWLLPGDVVSVPPKEFIKISVLGAIQKPGIYELARSDASLLKALASAQGLTQRASTKGIEIKRIESDETTIVVNLADVLEGKSQDVRLEDGDVIFVDEKFF